MASLRVDRFMNEGDILTNTDNFNQTAFSPKFGLVYQPMIDKVSVFANYMNGFQNVAPSTDVLADGSRLPRTFTPERAYQFELGTKLNFFKDRLFATMSYYDIQVENMAYTVYGATTQTAFQDGAQKNKGFEAEIVANPVAGLNITLGYSYNDSILTSGDPDFVGHRPESAGPQNMANLWASYKFSGRLKGFGLGLGGNYASENKIMNRTTAGVFTLPDYTIINASAFYGLDSYLITFKINNLNNKQAYDGWSTIHPLMPRNVSASLSYKF
jgi:iron complex outermembrane receptor protein